MSMDRRDFFKVSAGATGLALLSSETSVARAKEDLPEAIQKLKPMTDGIKPKNLPIGAINLMYLIVSPRHAVLVTKMPPGLSIL